MRVCSMLLCVALSGLTVAGAEKKAGPWHTLFDGKSLDGWRISENKEAVRLEKGNMVLNGKRAHAFYSGKANGGTFTDFEAVAEFMTKPSANAGLFFHTQWQESGWPNVGYESQINATHGDWRKTASIYSFHDLKDPGHKDNEWVTKRIRVEGKRVQIWINDKQVVDWTEPADHGRPTKKLSSGTFAFQAHDPGSVVLVRSFKVRALNQ